ncbi:hypothetical protein B0I37DRAFT_72669 [Chaetomium sp. MPI-CAGE-AT-0009]|nr:hypothetical protein B0I37DRAFT_72669 [Chaetomium sp. MPI-CAGE-AT-0009]
MGLEIPRLVERLRARFAPSAVLGTQRGLMETRYSDQDKTSSTAMDSRHQQAVKTVAATQLNRLCDSCRSSFPSDTRWPWLNELRDLSELEGYCAVLRRSSILQLRKSSIETNCHICTLLLEIKRPPGTVIIDPTGRTELRSEAEFNIYISPIKGWYFAIHTDQYFPDYLDDLVLIPAYPRAINQPGEQAWTIRSSASRTAPAIQTLSDTNVHPLAIQQIKSWIRLCVEEHVNCKSSIVFPQDSSFRLVDIGRGADDEIHLIDVGNGRGSGMGVEEPEYITLSYRWTAETERTSLKTLNKRDFYRSIPTDGWPKVYQDAVSIARQLDVRYLWIDALCIVQDTEAGLGHPGSSDGQDIQSWAAESRCLGSREITRARTHPRPIATGALSVDCIGTGTQTCKRELALFQTPPFSQRNRSCSPVRERLDFSGAHAVTPDSPLWRTAILGMHRRARFRGLSSWNPAPGRNIQKGCPAGEGDATQSPSAARVTAPVPTPPALARRRASLLPNRAHGT